MESAWGLKIDTTRFLSWSFALAWHRSSPALRGYPGIPFVVRIRRSDGHADRQHGLHTRACTLVLATLKKINSKVIHHEHEQGCAVKGLLLTSRILTFRNFGRPSRLVHSIPRSTSLFYSSYTLAPSSHINQPFQFPSQATRTTKTQ